METSKFRLIDYDVWGNEEDGWDVNGATVVVNDITVEDKATEDDLLEYLLEIEYLLTSDPELVTIDMNSDFRYEIKSAVNGKPLGALEKVG